MPKNNDAGITAEEIICSIDTEADTCLSYRLYMSSEMTKGRQDIVL